MLVKAVKTRKVTAGSGTLEQLLDDSLHEIKEGSIIAITSKVVALCENRVLPIGSIDKEELIKQESDLYLPSNLSKYGHHFTILRKTLISVSGIDESNSGGDYYVLWPKDPQRTANEIRSYLKSRFGLEKVGVIITDSTCTPMRRGTVGTPIGYSGFKPTNDYIGQPDLFGRPFKVSQSGVAVGLAATAVLAMGEGTEQTPVVVIEKVPFVKFQEHNPSQSELDEFYIPIEEDLFAPFLQNADWHKGGRHG